jgi:3-deoxy-manno-octulosonate cytidylyltransferase (CMP-KDO synthetase)
LLTQHRFITLHINNVQHTYENAKKSGAATVIIATADKRIEKVANGFGATTCMTNEAHTSGTARIAQVLEMELMRSVQE